MMNQYYGFQGRGGRFDCDRAPYRRPMNRSGMMGNQIPRNSGGCGCGMNRGGPLPYGRENGQHTPDEREHSRPTAVGGCGCNRNETLRDTGACHRLMEQIRAVDFALYETVLYLDVYPHSCDALETYRKLMEQREALHKEYEMTHGPLTAFGNQSTTSWDWMNKPFPWEYDAD